MKLLLQFLALLSATYLAAVSCILLLLGGHAVYKRVERNHTEKQFKEDYLQKCTYIGSRSNHD